MTLDEGIKTCQRCALSQTRLNAVVGTGAGDASIMFVGEAPGRNEDEGGEPFIGAAGRVLDEFLAHAELDRSHIFITNVVKCRPPHNRKPTDDEVAACKPWLEEQIKNFAPDVIVTLGAVASQALLGSTAPMKEQAGTISSYTYTQGAEKTRLATVLSVYHPAATIYNRSLRDTFFASADTLRALVASEIGERNDA